MLEDAARQTPNAQHVPIARSEGVTSAERYLKRLVEHTFLSLWSYAGLFRDQKADQTGDGKELCDLLVVFGDDIIIFSDKACVYKDTGRIEVDWRRWFKKAIVDSANQIWGAERWIREHPNRVFLDRTCTQHFPITLPPPAQARIHRIVVAHNISEHCRDALGGTGTLLVMPSIVGSAHYDEKTGGMPFAIGQLNPAKGFVHVLDDASLDIVLTTLDTITDFVAYLNKKEQLILGGRLTSAAGEDDLLGYYLRDLNDDGEHDFVLPRHAHASASAALVIDEGFWEAFTASLGRQAQIQANRESYIWDAIIEEVSGHALKGTYYYSSDPDILRFERALRFMARESRLQRRMLGSALLDLLRAVPATMGKNRILLPSYPGQPYYAYVVYPQAPGQPEDEYQAERQEMLQAVCLILKLKFPMADDIIGLATESGWGPSVRNSWGLLYFDGRLWNDELQAEAEQIQKETGLLTKTQTFRRSDNEYPELDDLGRRRVVTPVPIHMKGRDRNAPCPCGSGKKFKRCCGM